MWAWKRLKLRYALDATDTSEFRSFRRAFASAASTAERGLVVGLMLARTDRLFREVTLAEVSPYSASEPHQIHPSTVAADVDDRRRASGLSWSAESLRSVTNHIVSSWRETGFIASGRGITTTHLTPGPVVGTFAAALGQAQGLTDRAAIRSNWFHFLGADESGAIELLRKAAAAGLLTFRLQADVAEIRIVDPSGAAA